MTEAAKLAKQIMGPDAEKIRYTLKSGRHTGLRLNFPNNETATKSAMKFIKPWWRKAHATGLQLFVGQPQFHVGPGQYSDGWRAVSWDPSEGSPPPPPDPKDFPPTVVPVYALPDIKWSEVMDFAEVGTHNDWYAGIETMLADPEKYPIGPELAAGRDERLKYFKQLGIKGETQPEQTASALSKIYRLARFVIVEASPAGLKARFVRPVSEKAGALAGELIFAIACESYKCGPEGISDRVIENEQFKLWWD